MCNEFRPVSPHDVGKRSAAMRDVENAFPTSSTAANIGSNGLVRKPPVRKQHKQHEMLSGFESQRASGFTGVVDLLLHPQDDDHVVVGTGFAQVLVVELQDGQGKKPKADLHVAGHHNSVQGIAMHNKEPIFATVGLDCLLILWDATKPIPLQVKTLREVLPLLPSGDLGSICTTTTIHMRLWRNMWPWATTTARSRSSPSPLWTRGVLRKNGATTKRSPAPSTPQWSRTRHRVARQRHLPHGRRGQLSGQEEAARP